MTTVDITSVRAMPQRTRSAAGRWNTSTQLILMMVGNHTTQGSFEHFGRDRFIIGGKASAKEEITRYREPLGVDYFIMCCQWPGLPQERVPGSIQRLGEIFAS